MSDLGFAGAGGVGRPFTIQDLFGALTAPTTTATTTPSIVNQYLDDEDAITVTDDATLTAFSPRGYDQELWQDGVWT